MNGNNGQNNEPVNMTDEQLAAELAKLSRHNWVFYLALAVGIIFFIAGFITQLVTCFILGVVIIFAAIVVFGGKGSKRKKLIADNVITGTLKSLFNAETYEPASHIDSQTVKNANLVQNWNTINGSDLLRGSYRGMNFTFSDIKLEEVTQTWDSDGETQEQRDERFSGQWLVCSTNRCFDGTVRIIEKQKKLIGGKKAAGNIETEDVEFNDKYDIYADDPHTAFYILTPQFMNFIKSADAAAQGRTMLCFRENEVHFAVENNRNLFEIASNVKDINAIRASIKSDAAYLTGIFDELLKNDYLFGDGKENGGI